MGRAMPLLFIINHYEICFKRTYMSVIYNNEDNDNNDNDDNDKNNTTNDYKDNNMDMDNNMDNNMDMDNENNNESSIFMSLIEFNIKLFQHSCY